MAETECYIYGVGGHGKVVLDTALSAGFNVLGFADDDTAKQGQVCLGYSIISPDGMKKSASVLLGIGDNVIRRQIYDRLRGDFEFPVLIHPSASVSGFAELGAGTVVFAGSAVNPSAVIGEGCIINTGAVVEHDCMVGAFSHLSPNSSLAGGVSLGELVHVGTNACVIPLKTVGSNCVIAAGAAVINDIDEGWLVAGVPAEKKRKV